MKTLTILLLSVFFLFLVMGCFKEPSSVATKCLDGWGEDSFFSNTDKSVNNSPWTSFSPPAAVIERRVAYLKYSCDEPTKYFVKTNDSFNNVSLEDLRNYVKAYNSSCDGCLEVYISGCC